MNDQLASPVGHLEYYLRHGLNPVRYEMNDLQRHFDRRGSLYRILGLPPRLFRKARVLEVAPGSGQNSLYVANLKPRELVLVEPNPVAQGDIEKLYRTPGASPVQPRLVPSTFENFDSKQRFDVVICENWLGQSPEHRCLLRKLSRLTARGGMLIVTAIAPVGIVGNVLRKALACRIDRPQADFSERTALFTEAFGPHLATIPAMTRTCTDWVHDNIMNPAYFGILLTIPMVLEELGTRFDVFGSSPRFATDWRWFKGLCGAQKEFNRHFLGEYYASLHNFLDYRRDLGVREPARNHTLETAAWRLIKAVAELEQCPGSATDRQRTVESALIAIESNLRDLPATLTSSLAEFRELFGREDVTAEDVARMREFRGLFGRETLYLSLEKRTQSPSSGAAA